MQTRLSLYEKLSEMLNKEINNCENLASKSKKGSEKGAKIIQSTIFYILEAAIWEFFLIYSIFKAYEQKSPAIEEFTESGRNQFSYRNWLPKSVLVVAIAIAIVLLMKCWSKLQIIKNKIDDIINQVSDVKSSIATLKDELENVRELLGNELSTQDMESLTGRYSRLQETVKKLLAKK